MKGEPLMVPPAGFEPAHPPSEGDALSPELRGLSPGGSAAGGEAISEWCFRVSEEIILG
jgi:hypothetical protein